jgi:outer membrane protein TolC
MMEHNYKIIMLFIIITIFCSQIVFGQNVLSNDTLKLSLSQCIDLTLKNNNTRNVRNYALQVAESKIKQANSGHYPSLDLRSGYTIQDQDMNFIMPQMEMQIPSMNFGSMFIPSLTFNVPEQNIKVMDKQSIGVQVDLMVPIFLGGKISSLVKQAQSNLEMTKQDVRANDNQIILETKRLYYSVILADHLKQLAQDASDRMSSTLEFTEALYTKGSGKVTRSDYLKNKVFVDAIKSIVSQLNGEYKVAKSALVFTMGLNWNNQIAVTENEFPNIKVHTSLDNLVDTLFARNPIIAKVENGLNALNAKIDESKSDYYPSVALMGTYRRVFSDYDYGFTTLNNKNTWIFGIGMSMNLFNGMRTSAQIEEAKANYGQLSEQKQLLIKGLTVKLQALYYELESSNEKTISSKDAATSATENRELIEKAYFADLMELEDLIQAQLTESMMNAQYELVQYQDVILEAELEALLSSYVK